MKAIFKRSGGGWIGLATGLILHGVVFAQGDVVTSGSSNLFASYLQDEESLAQSLQSLISKNATPGQFLAWSFKNSRQIQACRELGQTLAMTAALQPRPLSAEAQTPATGSGVLDAYLATQASLETARAELHNQLLQSLPPGASWQQLLDMQQSEAQQFRQQHAADLQLQFQRASSISAAQAAQPLPVPALTTMTPDVSPENKAFLAAANAFIAGRNQVWNQTINEDPATRAAAMQQWRQKNGALISHVRQAFQTLPTTTQQQQNQ